MEDTAPHSRLIEDTAPQAVLALPPGGTRGRRAGGRERAALAGILAVAAVLRLAWLAVADLDPVPFFGGDPWAYLRHGEELARGRGYHNLFTGVATAFYPPGWPFLLAGVFFVAFHTPLTDDPETLARAVNLVLGVATVALAWWIGRRVMGPAVGLVAAAIVACWPNLVMLTAVASIETVFAFLVLATVALLLRMPWDGRLLNQWSVAAGLVLGALLLVRPMGAPVVLALVVALVAAGRGWRDALSRAAVVTGVALAVLVPTLVRNWAVVGAPVLSTNIGDTLCIGYWEGATGGGDYGSPACASEGPGPPRPEDELTRTRELTREAVEFVADDPWRTAVLVAKRGWHALDGDHDALRGLEFGAQQRLVDGDARRALVRTADLYYHAVGLASVAGLWWWLRARDPGRLLVVVSALGLAATPLYLYGDHRFLVPAFPFVALFAAAPLVAGARRLAASRGPGPRSEHEETAQ